VLSSGYHSRGVAIIRGVILFCRL